jgi:hypothetical protein
MSAPEQEIKSETGNHAARIRILRIVAGHGWIHSHQWEKLIARRRHFSLPGVCFRSSPAGTGEDFIQFFQSSLVKLELKRVQ